MSCPSCGHEPPAGSLFCNGCGARLEIRCASCGATPPPASRFCNGCGAPLGAAPAPSSPAREPRAYTPQHLAEKILRTKSALEGERKQVTVLFADVQGSMELAEQLDPEEWHRILDRFFEILADGVHRFEGTVNQYTGDGIMALFGAPIAHEDHAQRACYAALQLRSELDRYATEVKREHGVGISVRMGLNSGDVVVGKIGDDLRMDYTAQGHTVGLAQRMEGLASPDTCYLSDATAALVAGYFELEDLGEFRLKGTSEPVRVHRLAGAGTARTRFDVSRARGLTRFVGRDADMRLLDDALAQARAGNGQVVGVVAPAGTGKSRLCFEFSERCRAERLEVLEGRAVAHGKNLPFLPILEIFRGYFGIDHGDADRTVREKVAGRLLLIDDALRGELPVLFEFLGVPDPDQPALKLDADARQRRLFALMHRLAREDVGPEPRVYLLEDLHWIDGGSEAFLEQMVEATVGTRNLVLVNFRPEYRAGWMGRSWYRQLPLAPLGADAIRELLQDLLGDDPSTAGLAETIHGRTGGNPFFTEEVVQSLIESGHLQGARGAYRLVTPVEQLGVPPSVQAVLAARIDRLAEREKRVLQAAAVIGKDFERPILEPVAELPGVALDAALSALKDGEFVYEQALYPVAEYAFKHPLTQEVALGSLLRERRRELHRAVARAIEEARADDLDEHAALLAHHWEEAGDALTSARWHRRAAAWAGNTDVHEAMRHWERVRALVRAEPSAEAQALRLAGCQGLLSQGWRLGEDLSEVYEEGRAIAETRGDPDATALLLAQFARSVAGRGEVARNVALVEESLKLAPGVRDLSIRANAWMLGMDAANWIGDTARTLELRDQYLAQFPHEPAFGSEIWGLGLYPLTLHIGAFALSLVGRFAEAERDLRRSAELGVELEQFEIPAWSSARLTVLAYLRGDERTATSEAQRAASLTERAGGSAQLRVYVAQATVLAHLAADAFDAAVATAEGWLALYREERVEVLEKPYAYALLCAALCGLGRFAEALSAGEQAIELARAMPRRVVELEARIVSAPALARERGPAGRDEVERSLAAAGRLIEQTGARPWLPQLHEARARVAEAFGEAATRERELREAHRLYVELGCPGHAARLEKTLTQ